MYSEGKSNREIQLERELNENKQFFGELLVELQKIKQKNKQFEKEISELKQEKEYFQKEISELEQEIKQLEEEISELKDENEKTKIIKNEFQEIIAAQRAILRKNNIAPIIAPTEQAQLALDNFWTETRKRNIGELYERYIGYQYELKGWNVEYVGIKNGKEDLGRDLICYKDNTIHIVQCKMWALFKVIPDVYIFQLLGSTREYELRLRNENPNAAAKVQGVFYTTTVISNEANSFAKQVGIVVNQSRIMPQTFPVIKAVNNINPKLKRYYIPTDNGYEYIKLDLSKGDKYFDDAFQAVQAGFHR